MTDRVPHLDHRGEQPCVEIPLEATLGEWSEVNALVGELLAWLAERSEALAGAPFYRYRVIGDETTPFQLAVGVPTERRLDGDGRITGGVVPAGIYAVVVHEGPPDELDTTHATLQEWAASEGHHLAREETGDRTVWNGRYESFLTDPEEEPDRSEWETEVAYRVETDLPAGLSAPTRRALANGGYSRLAHLHGTDVDDVAALHGIGPAVVATLAEALVDDGLSFDDGDV